MYVCVGGGIPQCESCSYRIQDPTKTPCWDSVCGCVYLCISLLFGSPAVFPPSPLTTVRVLSLRHQSTKTFICPSHPFPSGSTQVNPPPLNSPPPPGSLQVEALLIRSLVFFFFFPVVSTLLTCCRVLGGGVVVASGPDEYLCFPATEMNK